MNTVYVISSGDERHGFDVFGATTDIVRAKEIADKAETHHHYCYGLDECERTGVIANGEWYTPHVQIRTFTDNAEAVPKTVSERPREMPVSWGYRYEAGMMDDGDWRSHP